MVLTSANMIFHRPFSTLFFWDHASAFLGFILAILLVVENIFAVKPYAFATYEVFPDRIELHQNNSMKLIAYKDITKIQFFFIRYLGGWMTLTSQDGARYSIPSNLERSEYILETLKASHPSLVSDADFYKFRASAIISDHSWARYFDLLKDWRKILIFRLINPISIAALIFVLRQFIPRIDAAPGWWQFFNISLVMLMLSLVGGWLCWFAAEAQLMYHYSKRLAADPRNVLRDMDLEKKMRDRWSRISLALVPVAAACLLLMKRI